MLAEARSNQSSLEFKSTDGVPAERVTHRLPGTSYAM